MSQMLTVTAWRVKTGKFSVATGKRKGGWCPPPEMQRAWALADLKAKPMPFSAKCEDCNTRLPLWFLSLQRRWPNDVYVCQTCRTDRKTPQQKVEAKPKIETKPRVAKMTGPTPLNMADRLAQMKQLYAKKG